MTMELGGSDVGLVATGHWAERPAHMKEEASHASRECRKEFVLKLVFIVWLVLLMTYVSGPAKGSWARLLAWEKVRMRRGQKNWGMQECLVKIQIMRDTHG